MAIGIFYGVRSICLSIFHEQKPEGINWAYPGVMSIFVPYGQQNDLFYSGHVGICVIQFLEFQDNLWTKWSYFAIFTGVC